jgi:hypothetical protein
MLTINYYLALFLSLGFVLFGVLYILEACYRCLRLTGKEDSARSRHVVLSRFISGVVNILIGLTFYAHLSETPLSVYLILWASATFALWEWHVRTYFINQTHEPRSR